MKRVKPFSQKTIIDKVSVQLPTKGVCFRLTFKWAACTLVGGRFNWDANPDKTATKHTAYRGATLAMEKRVGGDFSKLEDLEAYTAIDFKETKAFVNEWGAGFTDANKAKFTGVYVEDQSIDPMHDYLAQRPSLGKASIVAGFYGRKNSAAWGHVVAFSTEGSSGFNGPCFFDANSGLWTLAAHEDAGQAIRNYIRTCYRKDRTIEHFNTMVLKQR